MDLVIDANIIFAVLIKENKTYELIFDEKLHLFTAEFFFKEFEKHVREIQKKSGKAEKDFNQLMDIIKTKIILVPLEELLPYLDEAEEICPDPDDVAYFALALKLKCAVWSQDRALKEKQNKVKVYSTEDLMRMFG